MKNFAAAFFLFVFFTTFPTFAETDAVALVASRKHDAMIDGLRDLLARRDAFFDEMETLSENERLRRAADVAERFDAFLSRFPESVPARYFYAEFLRDGGENARAEKLLSEAEKIEPTFAPVQFLFAEILASRGAVEEALPRFFAAVSADPGNARARGVFGEFLLEKRERLLEKKCFASRAEIDAKMQSEFLAACAADAENFGAFWRFAESFYDVENPNWERALAAWERVERKIPAEKRAELLPAVALHRARALAELGRFDEADAILRETAGVPALERSRRKVFEILTERKNGK